MVYFLGNNLWEEACRDKVLTLALQGKASCRRKDTGRWMEAVTLSLAQVGMTKGALDYSLVHLARDQGV